MQQLIFPVNEHDVQRIEDALLEMGALSVTLTDAAKNTAQEKPILEPGVGETPLWGSTTLTALFGRNDDVVGIMMQLTTSLELAGTPDYRVDTVADQDWTRAWLKDFKPLQFGKRLWIVPSAFEPPEPDAVNILLDPGLAFGTGTHPTTALCLEWLEKQTLTGKTVLDFGCGSGVLAIAALKLGTVAALGVDNDPQALTASRDNAIRNDVSDRLELVLPEAIPNATFPVLVANILANPLIELAPQLAKLTIRGGYIALSGILAEQGALVEKAYAPYFYLNPVQEKEGWLLISGQRKS